MQNKPIRRTTIAPIQKPEKLPDTIPESIVSDAPPSLEATTTSWVCFALGLVNTLVASGMRAAPNVPQEIIIESTSHKFSPISLNR